MYGAFKQLKGSDIFLTKYVARKHWTETITFTDISSSDPEFNAIKSRFYDGMTAEGVATGSVDLNLETTTTIPGARKIVSQNFLAYCSLNRNKIGLGIEKGSVKLTRTYGTSTTILVDKEGVLVDSLEENIKGDVLYSEGLLVLTQENIGTYTLEYTSLQPIHTLNISCKVFDREFNYSLRKSFRTKRKDNPGYLEDIQPYVTSVGLYNREGDLIAVAKLSSPIKKVPVADFTFNVKLDLT